MYKSYFTPEENQNCVMEPDALSVFKKDRNAPGAAQPGQKHVLSDLSGEIIDPERFFT